MNRIRNLNIYPKVILLILAVMALLFGLIYIRTTSQKGYEYKEEIFLPSYENGKTIYSGKLYDAQCSFSVTSDKVVSFRFEDKYYGPYTAVEDPTAIPAEYAYSANAVGVELRNNGKLMFRGVALTNQESGFHLIDENGDLFGWGGIVVLADGTQFDEHGNPVDPWEPDVYTLLELMGQPELTNKGHWGVFFCAILASAFTAVTILFADELFRLGLVFRVRDWELAEPSDFEVAGRYISWIILTIMVFVCYLMGLN